ncbi:thiol-disulfide oxidoreductase DCC family protein [Brevibacterium litoralis]|uniref:thiol-disulfide oxidoreductase DCC family protein n=1 Tax=Brevibacterium litoralis TaxID=3138935 RepID=UPI0032EF05C8
MNRQGASGAELVVLFDGLCGMCTRWARTGERLDGGRGRVRFVANQVPGVVEEHGLTRAMVDHQIWAFDRAGRATGGAQAVGAIAQVLAGSRQGCAGVLPRVLAWPGIVGVVDGVYQWVARNRRHFPGATPWCTANPGGCGVHEA